MEQRQPHLQLSAMDCKNILPYVEQHLGTVMVSAQDPQPKDSLKKLYDYLNARVQNSKAASSDGYLFGDYYEENLL
jgi:hypothetical protein